MRRVKGCHKAALWTAARQSCPRTGMKYCRGKKKGKCVTVRTLRGNERRMGVYYS
jgi:hypothetical protein